MKLPLYMLTVVAGFTIGASPVFCSTAIFSSITDNPANHYQPLSASAMFSLTGNQLTIEVHNSAGANSHNYVDTDVLTGVFFGTDAQNLTPVSATAPKTVDATGTAVCVVDCDTGTGWEYKALTTPEFGMMNGISALEWTPFLFSNFASVGAKLRGTSFGVVPNTYPGDNGSLLTESPYAVGSTTFTAITPDSFTLATIHRVAFLWGTSADNVWAYGDGAFFVGAEDVAPEPGTWALASAALAMVLVRVARRRPANAASQRSPEAKR